MRACVGLRVLRSELPPPIPSLAARILVAAFSVGKEVFLLFAADGADGESAIRLHFGMSGSLFVRRNADVSPQKSSRKNAGDVAMTLVFAGIAPTAGSKRRRGETLDAGTVAEAWGANVTRASASAAREKLDRLRCRDSCGEHFSASHVVDVLREAGRTDPRLIVADAVLDQENFPGVGNIIKVEGLHRAKVDPRRCVEGLSDAELRKVVAFCRRYSMDWLKNYRAPDKRVYNRTTCATCNNATISMQKVGGGPSDTCASANPRYMSRTTFWCRVCQPSEEPPAATLQLNSVQEVGTRPTEAQRLLLLRPPPPGGECPQHGVRPVVLRRVKRNSPNLSRIFRSCTVGGCQFFAWADGHMPSCRCGRRAVLRMSKTERSGGRWFLSCAKGDGRVKSAATPCGFFEWAGKEHLDPLGNLLTPLL